MESIRRLQKACLKMTSKQVQEKHTKKTPKNRKAIEIVVRTLYMNIA